VEQELHGAAAKPQGAQVNIGISVRGKDLLNIHCPQQSLVTKLKSLLGLPAPARNPLGSRINALKPTRVATKGVLGRAELSVSELEGLAIGDVLILDRALSDTAELRLVETDRLVASGKLHCENGQMCIRV
jgi:flagellar motor switch/type III secretory pathway protein FliN